MSLNLLAKAAMAGVVLTGGVGTAALESFPSTTHEAKAEANVNQEHFKKTIGDTVLDFTDILSRNTLSPKDLTLAVKDKLEKQGLNAGDYRLKLKVKMPNGSYLESHEDGNLIVGNEHLGTQTAEFNPTKHKMEIFEIVPK
ncbi:hypothetical protein [Staphylococcus aureus]|uniref:hypothetical protein n=1 Tax=Staphylococcus aureus TaxID=1280 RepID=UPI00202EDB7C|nr:hypothetical protein [Staphylococcus aureus]MCM0467354.1 hypothetical protein [Staphylococcus aureus]MCM0472511.1 hypothetical protein [Staphylococcus aureus]MCM0482880.1 hypothetical protein [Staphylococcus aureus]MCM0569099.1 hypothetical protein [Staphylococcus aureus]